MCTHAVASDDDTLVDAGARSSSLRALDSGMQPGGDHPDQGSVICDSADFSQSRP